LDELHENENGREDIDLGRLGLVVQYCKVPVGCSATPGNGAVAVLVRGDVGCPLEEVLELDSKLLIVDVQEDNRDGDLGTFCDSLLC